MERKIGEIFEYNGEWYQCVKGDCCRNCDFYDKFKDDICFSINNCSLSHRSDKTSVVFKKLEKVGDPFERQGHFYQEYKAHTFPLLMNGGVKLPTANGFAVIIKQNKEDMKEKKIKISKEDATYLLNELHYILDGRLSGEGSDKIMDDIIQILDVNTGQPNLKPFNLEEAKADKPVCTRDGRKARIICFDTKGDPCPIIALVEENGIEAAYHYDKNGQNAYNKSELDLMMLPEKKTGWINVYNSLGVVTFSHNPYDTREEAIQAVAESPSDRKYYVDTIKISWEE